MGNEPYSNVTMKQARRLLAALTDLARESSLTGSLEGGSKAGIRQYNSLLDHFVEQGTVPRDLFVRLDSDEDNFDDLGVACALLKAFIEDDDEQQVTSTTSTMIIHGDSQELRELRELGEILRERMPEKS